MTRITATGLLAALGWMAAATGAIAQSGGKIPVEADLRRAERIEDRIDSRRPDLPANPNYRTSDPGGVVGFSGPPGIVGDSVNSFDPLPQGATGADIR